MGGRREGDIKLTLRLQGAGLKVFSQGFHDTSNILQFGYGHVIISFPGPNDDEG